MGDPATPTPVDRAAARRLASAIVGAVTNDERHPLAPGDHGTLIDASEEDIETAMFQLAQEIVALTAERDACWSRLDNWDWRGLQRDARRGDYSSIVDALRDIVAMEESRESAMSDEMENANAKPE